MAHVSTTGSEAAKVTAEVIEVMKLDLGPNDKLLIRCGFPPNICRLLCENLEWAFPDLAGRIVVMSATIEPAIIKANEDGAQQGEES